MNCNATLTTATVSCGEDDCGSVYHHEVHVELHTLTCSDANPEHTYDHFDSNGVCWSDDTKGATPHTPTSTVTDAEVEAARRILNLDDTEHERLIRTALEAAAAVRGATTCAQCNESKPLADFDHQTKVGRYYVCRECVRHARGDA